MIRTAPEGDQAMAWTDMRVNVTVARCGVQATVELGHRCDGSMRRLGIR